MSGQDAWADAMQALTFFSVAPTQLGGIVIRAAAGPVRDRFMVLLAEALGPDRKQRRLPPNITDDRLLGGLDLPATLQANRPIAQVGILAEADGGVLVLPMAERTDSALAARLRAVMDEGAVTLQRDGLSGAVPARFGIVA